MRLCVYYSFEYVECGSLLKRDDHREVLMLNSYLNIFLIGLGIFISGGNALGKTTDLYSEKDPDVKIGIRCDNKYAVIAFLNPSAHRSSIKYEEFNRNLPLVDTADMPTFNENNAKIRMFFKPNLRCWSVGRRREYLVGKERWELKDALQANGAEYSRYWQRGSNKIHSVITAKFSSDKAEVFIEAKFTNLSRNDCQVEFHPVFSFLRNRDLNFVMPRKYSGFIGGKPRDFYYGYKEKLTDSEAGSFWWRKVAQKADFIEFASRERIPFNTPELTVPDFFSFIGLPGKTNLIWDVAMENGKKDMQYWEVGWDDMLAEAVPAWLIYLKRRETRTINFRIITVKGLDRVDMVKQNWVLGYGAEHKRNKVHLEFVPLKPVGDCELIGKIVKASGNIQSEQRVELAAMHPFAVGGKVWQASDIFERAAFYPITLSVTPKDNSSLSCKIESVIVP